MTGWFPCFLGKTGINDNGHNSLYIKYAYNNFMIFFKLQSIFCKMPDIVINCAYSFAVLMEDMREMYI